MRLTRGWKWKSIDEGDEDQVWVGLEGSDLARVVGQGVGGVGCRTGIAMRGRL